MSLSTRMVVVLTLIAMLSGGILAGWDAITKPRIEEHRRLALQTAIKEVLPPHHHYETQEGDGLTLYIAHPAESDSVVGIAFLAIGSGFQGELRIMVGTEENFQHLTGMQVLEQIETPGLGTKIVEDPSNKTNPLWFPQQFKGVSTDPEIIVIKNAAPSADNEIQGITGATISSKAVARIIGAELERARALYQGQEG